jgi:hypothetical protein
MNRELLKKAIKKIVLNEITKSDYGVGKISTDDELVGAVKKSIGSAGEAIENPLSGKVAVDDKAGGRKYQCEIVECGEGLYNVTVIKHGSDRKAGRQLSAEKLSEFLKDTLQDDLSAVDKARMKSMKAAGRDEEKDEKAEEKNVKKEEKQEDQMTDVEPKTQKDIADKATKKATEKPDKEVAPIEDKNAPQLGGELTDVIEKIINRVLFKNKTGLKADPSKESPDKRLVKLKDTPEIKGTEKPIGKPSPTKAKED